ncbi:YdbC family protein [Eubacterium aggregans]|uniref:YdbC family protein n=1 Tax=Eubacterium aggregans TaxID=81409 RepID=UPI003F3F25CE
MAFKFEVVEEIGVLSEGSDGWQKELNLVSWNERDPKYDIREWDANHEKMRKGVTLSVDELAELKAILNDLTLD